MTESARASNLRPATESRYSVPRIRGEPDARSLAGVDRGAEKGLDPTVPARPAREEGEVRVPDSPRTPRAVERVLRSEGGDVVPGAPAAREARGRGEPGAGARERQAAGGVPGAPEPPAHHRPGGPGPQHLPPTTCTLARPPPLRAHSDTDLRCLPPAHLAPALREPPERRVQRPLLQIEEPVRPLAEFAENLEPVLLLLREQGEQAQLDRALFQLRGPLRRDFGHPVRLVSGARYIGFRSPVASSTLARIRSYGCIPPRNAIIVWIRRKKGRGDAYFWRLALARKYRAGPMAMPTTASCAARIVKGVRFTPTGRLTNASVEISGS